MYGVAGLSSPTAQRRIAALAGTTSVHRAFHWLHLHQPQIEQWLLALVRIPAPTFEEEARAMWFEDRFREIGLAGVHRDEVGNVLGEIRPARTRSDFGADQTPVLLLSAHLDTVFPIETSCEPRTEAGTRRIYAPGISDNGAGLSALLAIAAALRSAEIGLPVPLLFAANVGEEGEGDLRGMRHLFQAGSYTGSIGTAIALEGAGTATVVDRALGSRRLRVTVRTAGGHSWTNFGAANAIMILAGMLVELDQMELPAEPRTTLNVGKIEGGTSVNSIAAEASALLDLRSTDSGQLAWMEAEVREMLLQSAARRGLGPLRGSDAALTIESIGDRPAAALPSTSELLQTIRAVDRHLNLRTESRVGSTDANLPLSLGIPAVAMAAGGNGGGVHTTGEWYDGSRREIALRRILLAVLDSAQVLADARAPTRGVFDGR